MYILEGDEMTAFWPNDILTLTFYVIFSVEWHDIPKTEVWYGYLWFSVLPDQVVLLLPPQVQAQAVGKMEYDLRKWKWDYVADQKY